MTPGWILRRRRDSRGGAYLCRRGGGLCRAQGVPGARARAGEGVVWVCSAGDRGWAELRGAGCADRRGFLSTG